MTRRPKKNPDRWNLAKFKILMTLSNSGAMNSVKIAERTFKTVPQTTNVLQNLLRQKLVKRISCTSKNDGCSHKYKITPQGERYLPRLRERFIHSQSLNFKYAPYPVLYKEIDLKWWEQEEAIEQKHLDEVAENLKNPLSAEYAADELRKTGATQTKALPPKAMTQDEIDAILKDIKEKYEH